MKSSPAGRAGIQAVSLLGPKLGACADAANALPASAAHPRSAATTHPTFPTPPSSTTHGTTLAPNSPPPTWGGRTAYAVRVGDSDIPHAVWPVPERCETSFTASALAATNPTRA